MPTGNKAFENTITVPLSEAPALLEAPSNGHRRQVQHRFVNRWVGEPDPQKGIVSGAQVDHDINMLMAEGYEVVGFQAMGVAEGAVMLAWSLVRYAQ